MQCTTLRLFGLCKVLPKISVLTGVAWHFPACWIFSWTALMRCWYQSFALSMARRPCWRASFSCSSCFMRRSCKGHTVLVKRHTCKSQPRAAVGIGQRWLIKSDRAKSHLPAKHNQFWLMSLTPLWQSASQWSKLVHHSLSNAPCYGVKKFYNRLR